MKKILAFIFALACCGIATAQVDSTIDYTPSGVTFRLGLGIPLEGDLLDDSPLAFSFGFDYELDFQLFGPGDTYLAFDWIAAEEGIYGLSLNKRTYTGTGNLFGRDASTYIFFGVGGVAYDSLDFDEMAIVARGGIGYSMVNNTVFEFGGWVGGDSRGVNITSLYASFGWRFP